MAHAARLIAKWRGASQPRTLTDWSWLRVWIFAAFGVAACAFAVFPRWWWDSAARYRMDGVHDAQGARRCYFMTNAAAPRIDAATGLAVRYLGDHEIGMVLSDPRSASYAEGWNEEILRRVHRGEDLGPRFRDRVVDVETMRQRFELAAESAIEFGRYAVEVHGCWVGVGPHRIIAHHGEGFECGNYMQSQFPPLPIGTDVRGIVPDDGKTLWLQGHRPGGVETYAVIDLERGWILGFLERPAQ